MGQIPEQAEHAAGIIQHIKLDPPGGIAHDQGEKHSLHQGRFPATAIAADQQIPGFHPIQRQRELPLSSRIIQVSGAELQPVFLAGPAALFQVQRMGQHRFPQGSERNALGLGHGSQLLQNGYQLRALGRLRLPGRPDLYQGLPHVIDHLHAVVATAYHLAPGLIGSAGPGGLAQGEKLVVAHLNIKPARILQFRRLRALQHVHAV